MLVKWQKIKEISIIKLEKLFKKPKDKVFLMGRLNTQFLTTSFLLPESSPFIYFMKE